MFVKASLEEKERLVRDQYKSKCRLSGKNAAI